MNLDAWPYYWNPAARIREAYPVPQSTPEEEPPLNNDTPEAYK